MPKMKEILDQCTVGELRECADACLLPDSNTKDELVRMLVEGYRPSQYNEILQGLGNETLKRLCWKYDLLVSGNKDTLLDRIFDIIAAPTKTDTAKKKCQMDRHFWDRRMLQEHHFIPKAVALTRWGYIGGVILLCGGCHNLFHRRLEEERKKKRRQLDVGEIRRLFNKTQKEVRAGKYGRK